MSDSTPKRSSVFIEKIFPVNLLNQQVYYEHGGNPFKGLHRWYSRKPLSFGRDSVLGSLLPADVSVEEFEYLLGLNRRVAGHPDTQTKLYRRLWDGDNSFICTSRVNTFTCRGYPSR